MENIPEIRVDLNNADAKGRVRLNTVAALDDIAALTRPLGDGAPLRLVDDELSVQGTAMFSPSEGIWTARIDWDAVF